MDAGSLKPTVEIIATDKAFKAKNCGTWQPLSATPPTEGPSYEQVATAAVIVVVSIGRTMTSLDEDVRRNLLSNSRTNAAKVLTTEEYNTEENPSVS